MVTCWVEGELGVEEWEGDRVSLFAGLDFQYDGLREDVEEDDKVLSLLGVSGKRMGSRYASALIDMMPSFPRRQAVVRDDSP